MSWNDFDCRKIPGYVGVVKKGNFLAVVATQRMGRDRGSRAIEAKWSDWAGLPDEAKLWEYVRNSKVAKDEDLQKVGDAAEALKTPNAKIVTATYDFAIHTHGSIGPSCAVAEFENGKLTVWTRVAADASAAQAARDMLAMKPEDVRCIYVEGAGCYGRNGHEDAAADAALIAKEIGLPVRVQWMRAGRARLGSEGSADAARLSRGARRPGQRRRLGVGGLHPGAAEGHRGRACCRRSSPACRHEASHPGQHPGVARRSRTRFRTSARPRTGSPTRRSARRGSARRGACRTPSATRASSTRSRSRPASIRSNSG